MEEFTDKNLICYFGWGRRVYIEQCFPKLLEAIRSQDRLLVVDQEMHNFDYYAQFKDRIDYLVYFKKNYRIGPAWEFFQYMARWLKTVKHEDVKWSPDFINIVESDALVQTNFIDRLMPLFNEETMVATGYLAENDPNTKIVGHEGEVFHKQGTQGVNIIVRTDDFLKVSGFPNFSQDCYFNDFIKGRVACIPTVEHIGLRKRKAGFFE